MDFGLSEEQELLQETVRGFVAGECPAPRLRELFEAGGPRPGALEGARGAGQRGPRRARGARRRGARAARTGARGRGPRRRRAAGPVLRPRARGPRAPARGQRRAAERAGCRASRRARRSGRSRSARTAALAARELDARASTAGASAARSPSCRRAGADLLVVGIAGGGLALVERGAPASRARPDGLDRTRPIARLRSRTRPPRRSRAAAGAAGARADAALVLLAADAFGAAWRLIADWRATTRGAAAVRQAARAVPGGEAPAREPRDRDRADARAVVVRGPRLGPLPAEAPSAPPRSPRRTSPTCAMDVARAAFELHGGIGFTWECDVQLWFKRAIFDRAFLGTPELHRERSARSRAGRPWTSSYGERVRGVPRRAARVPDAAGRCAARRRRCREPSRSALPRARAWRAATCTATSRAATAARSSPPSDPLGTRSCARSSRRAARRATCLDRARPCSRRRCSSAAARRRAPASSRRRCAARCAGARATASPAPAATSPRSRAAPSSTATSG